MVATILAGSGIAHFIGGNVVGAAVGFVVGCFTPAIGRKVKAWFSKEAAAVKAKL